MNNTVITRFAPSPTGFLHIGGVRTALFAYLFAKKNGGKFALRIEDTDKLRSKDEWTTGLIDDLNWLGLKHDIFVKQSDKADIHSSYIKKMIDSGHAYISKEKVVEEGQRDEVIRFKNPNKKVIIKLQFS
jgi:glutamyl/glutaminyl-tRNA synthetase